MALTGRFRYRKTPWGAIVLQLEHDRRIPWPLRRHGEFRQTWRNAKLSDLLQPEVRGILEIREFIQQFPQANHGTSRATVMRMFTNEAQSPRPKIVSDERDKEGAASA
jgi:hypothetical protein